MKEGPSGPSPVFRSVLQYAMPKFRDRICVKCGEVEYNTASRSDICLSCYWKNRSEKQITEEKGLFTRLYGSVEGPSYDKHNKRCYSFTHSCSTTQTWRYDNFLKSVKARPTVTPCSKCGATERIKPAMAGYVAKFQLDERARTDLRAYTRKVRGLSEKTYRDNIDVINPKRLPRMLGNQGYHLDHVTPIVECFKQGWTPETAAALSNLRMLSASDNLSKGRRASFDIAAFP